MTDCPCDICITRQYYARAFDMHFYGADCPYDCELYEEWKRWMGRNDYETD